MEFIHVRYLIRTRRVTRSWTFRSSEPPLRRIKRATNENIIKRYTQENEKKICIEDAGHRITDLNDKSIKSTM